MDAPEEEAFASALIPAATWLLNGTTTVIDASSHAGPGLVRALDHLGMRGVVTRFVVDTVLNGDGSTSRSADTDAELAAMRDLVAKLTAREDGRITGWPSFLYTPMASDDLLRGVKAITDEFGTGHTCHNSALANEREASRAHFGKTSQERLRDLGLVTDRFAGSHMGFLTDEEVEMFADAGSKANHAPYATGGIGQNYMSGGNVPALWRAEVPVSVGTDGGGRQRGDMWRNMAAAMLFHNEVAQNDRLVNPLHALRMGTLDAARFAGLEGEVGSLEVGKRADFLVIDLGHPKYATEDDLIALLIDSTGPADIDRVVIDGRVRVDRGRIPDIDMGAVRRDAIAAVRSFHARNQG